MQTVHAALALRFPDATLDRLPIYQHWEDEDLGYPPLYEALSIKVAPAGYPAWCTSNREGMAIEGIFSSHHDARHPDGAHALVFDADERAALRSHGWQGSSSWRARWSADQPAQVISAFAILATLSPRVLLPEDLPDGAPWPWAAFLFNVLLADVEGIDGAGEGRILRTIVDDEVHFVGVPEGSPWDTLWRWWCHQPPTMRPFSQLRRP